MTTNQIRLAAVQQALFADNFAFAEKILLDMWEKKEIDKKDFLIQAKKFSPPLQLPKEELLFIAKPIHTIGLNNMPVRQFLIDRFDIEKGNLICICGASNAGKTMFAQYLSLCVKHNISLFKKFAINNSKIEKKVLHIDFEQSELQTQRRYERIASFIGVADIAIDRIKLPSKLDSIDISQEEMKSALIKLMTGYDMVLIDSLRQSIQCDENSSQISYVFELLKSIAEITNTVIIVIHHKGKSPNTSSKDQGRGSSAIYAGFDVVIDLDVDDDSNEITLKCQKNREQIYFPSLIYKLKDGGNFNDNQRCSEQLQLILVEGEVKKDKKEAEILSYVINGQQIKWTLLYEKIKGDKIKFNELLNDMIQQQLLNEINGPKNSRIFSMGINGLTYLEGTK